MSNNLFSLAFLGQLGAFFILIALGWLINLFLWRPLNALQKKYVRTPWAKQLLTLIQELLLPLIVGLLNVAVVNLLFVPFGWPSHFLAEVVPFIIGLWLIYRLGHLLLHANLSPQPAQLWSQKVLLPVILFFAVLYGTGWQELFLSFRLTPADYDQNITVGSLLTGVIIAIVFFVIARLIWQFLEGNFLPQSGAEPALAHAMATLTAYSIMLVGVIAGLTITGFDLATLTVIAGGLSIGLGFGLQQIVSNFVSGFILMFERSIGPGDVIELGDTVGTVRNIGIRRMVIKTPDNKEVTIPNSHFLSDVMTNLTRDTPLTRVHIGVGVSYEANPREVELALLEAAQHPRVLPEPQPAVFFQEFGDNSLNFTLLVWTDNPLGIPALSSDLRYRVWDALTSREIEIPFPQRDIHIRSGLPNFDKSNGFP